MGRQSSNVVRFDLRLLQHQTMVANPKSAYNLLIIAPTCLGCETNQKEIMGWQSSDVVRFDLGPRYKDKQIVNNIKKIQTMVYHYSTN